MPQSDNYIKVKSGRTLRRQNEDSLQRINKAGSNDVNNQPGGTTAHSPIRNITGIAMPGSFTVTESFWGETLSSQSAGMGVGGVGMPPLKPRAMLSSSDLPFPYSYRSQWIGQSKISNTDDLPFSAVVAGSVEKQPDIVIKSGNLSNALERTTSLDGNRHLRARAAMREILIRAQRGK